MSRACNTIIFFGFYGRGAFVFSSLHCVAPCQPSSTSKQPTVAVGDFIEVEDVDDQQELFWRPARVLELLEAGNFIARVGG